MSKYIKAAAVTAHDSNDQSIDTRYGTPVDAIYIGVGGNVNLRLSAAGQGTVLFKNMIAGTIYPLSAKNILSTSTTATDIVALDNGSRYDD
tara:strand:+ start:403 stop:675 length:273 start_codon:yes stop_codon:yes gene_type:complete